MGDVQGVDILHSVIWESAASSHVQRAADVPQRLSPGARGSVKISQTAADGADRAIAAASAAQHFSSIAAASSSSSAAAKQLALSGRQVPGERRVGSQLLRGEEHEAERLLGQSLQGCNAAPSSCQLQQAVEDTYEVRLLC